MSPILGKRKRKLAPAPAQPSRSSSPLSDSDSAADNAQNLQDILRRHFEAKFAPLEGGSVPRSADAQPLDSGSSDEEDGDWDGLDDEDDDGKEEDGGVLIIEHGDTANPTPLLTKGEAKAFMTSKPPPTSSNFPPTKPHLSKPAPASTPTDALNLKNDLALHRLISESHLLQSSTPPARQKLLDHRLLALGSKSSILAQDKMPMAHRKGIVAKAAEREGRRRKEAKENGIVLEKVARVEAKGPERKRERGVTGPAAGRFKGATLRLTERDVRGIKGAGGKGRRR